MTMAQAFDPEGPEVVQGEVLYYPTGARNISYEPTRSLRRIDPKAIQVRRAGPLGLFENPEDAAHREAIIRQGHVEAEAIQMETSLIQAAVQGTANALEGADSILRMIDRTQPGTTLGRFAEDLGGSGLARIRDIRDLTMEDLTAESRNLFRNRRR
jgi:hypothetical protein